MVDPRSLDVGSLPFGNTYRERIVNALENAEIGTVAELTERSREELWRTKNLGRGSLDDIERVLGNLGLALKGSEPVVGGPVVPDGEPEGHGAPGLDGDERHDLRVFAEVMALLATSNTPSRIIELACLWYDVELRRVADPE